MKIQILMLVCIGTIAHAPDHSTSPYISVIMLWMWVYMQLCWSVCTSFLYPWQMAWAATSLTARIQTLIGYAQFLCVHTPTSARMVTTSLNIHRSCSGGIKGLFAPANFSYRCNICVACPLFKTKPKKPYVYSHSVSGSHPPTLCTRTMSHTPTLCADDFVAWVEHHGACTFQGFLVQSVGSLSHYKINSPSSFFFSYQPELQMQPDTEAGRINYPRRSGQSLTPNSSQARRSWITGPSTSPIRPPITLTTVITLHKTLIW